MANFIPEQENYKNLTPFKLAVLQNFPYIEADFDALTNYGLMCKIVEYLNNVISNENAVESNVTNLYNAFVSLNNYVSNYFDNLDVQEEINNKLDAMAQDGSLTALIKGYVDPIIDNLNAEFDIVKDEVASVVSGSPAGVYPTIAALQSADPDHTRIYVVEADGNWYFFNNNTNQWKNGGVYQAVVQNYDTTLTGINQIPNSKSVGDKINDNVVSENVFDVNNIINNSYVDETGNIVSNNSYLISNIIEVKNGDTLYSYYDLETANSNRTFQISYIVKCDNLGNFIERTQTGISHANYYSNYDGFIRLVLQKSSTKNDINKISFFKNMMKYSKKEFDYKLKNDDEVTFMKKSLDNFSHQFNYYNYLDSGDNMSLDEYLNINNINSYLVTNYIKVNNNDILYLNDFNGKNVTYSKVWKFDENLNKIERNDISGKTYTSTFNGYVVFVIRKPATADTIDKITISKNEKLSRYYDFGLYPLNDDISKVSINKIDNTNYIINFGKYKIKLFYTNNTSTNSHNWNIKELSNGNNILVPSGTDIIGPVQINDNTDFIGGVHGDETTDYATVSINGSSYNLEDVANLSGNSLTLNLKSTVYDETTKLKAFDRYVTIIFTENKMKVVNSFKAFTSLTLKRATGGGLIACNNSIIKDIMFNNSYYPEAPTESVVNSSPYNTTATINTIYGSITVNNIKGHENSDYRGLLNVFANETPMRCKVYFDLYKQGTYQISANQIITGEFEYILS